MALRLASPKAFSARLALQVQVRPVSRASMMASQSPGIATGKLPLSILRRSFVQFQPRFDQSRDSDRIDVGLSSRNVSSKSAMAQANQDAAAKETGGGGGGGGGGDGGSTTASASASSPNKQNEQNERNEQNEQSGHVGGSDDKHPMPDAIADGDARGKTGGGHELGSTSENAPPQPKILNAGVSGKGDVNLSREQKEEVDRHNEEFKHKFDRGQTAPDDKVDDKFWTQKKKDEVDKEFWQEDRQKD